MADIEDTVCFSDSDEDLVGTNEPPSTIKTIHYSVHKQRSFHKNKGGFKNKYPNLSESKLSSHQGVIVKPSGKFSANNDSGSSPSSDDDWTEVSKSSQRRCTDSIPTMEPIDFGLIKADKINRYQRMREIKNITGFIVNVHDATNFDIDLDIPPNLHEKYQDVISNQYTYQDLGSDFLENPDLTRITTVTPKIGTTYRCRLRGVGINQLAPCMNRWKSNQICVEVKQLIDRTDGWITCTLSDIDVYQRLLVDIVVNTCRGPINLRDFLLTKMIGDDTPLFYPYSGKRDRNAVKHH